MSHYSCFCHLLRDIWKLIKQRKGIPPNYHRTATCTVLSFWLFALLYETNSTKLNYIILAYICLVAYYD